VAVEPPRKSVLKKLKITEPNEVLGIVPLAEKA
jgi:hypothetical protein